MQVCHGSFLLPCSLQWLSSESFGGTVGSGGSAANTANAIIQSLGGASGGAANGGTNGGGANGGAGAFVSLATEDGEESEGESGDELEEVLSAGTSHLAQSFLRVTVLSIPRKPYRAPHLTVLPQCRLVRLLLPRALPLLLSQLRPALLPPAT